MYAQWLRSYVNVSEQPHPLPLVVSRGALPAGLRGVLYRNGPGRFVEQYGPCVHNVLDGDGVVLRFEFARSQVMFSSRLVYTDQFHAEHVQQKRLYSGAFGSRPRLRGLKNPANTHVVPWGKHLLAFCESGAPQVMCQRSLSTLGTLRPFKQGLPASTGIRAVDEVLRKRGVFGRTACAHPKVHGKSLVVFSFVFSPLQTVVTFYEFDERLRLCKEVPVNIPGFVYFHDAVVTDTHYVFFKHNLKLEYHHLLHRGVAECMVSAPHPPSVLYAVPREEAARCVAPPQKQPQALTALVPSGFITHHAWSSMRDGRLTMLSVAYPHPFRLKVEQMMHSGFLFRTVWDLQGDNSVTWERASDVAVEFPCSDTRGNVYCVHSNGLAAFGSGGGTCAATQVWQSGPHAFYGEPVMLSEPYLAATCYDADRHESSLHVFDTRSLSRGPVAELLLPSVHPVGLHGSWLRAP